MALRILTRTQPLRITELEQQENSSLLIKMRDIQDIKQEYEMLSKASVPLHTWKLELWSLLTAS